MDEKCFIVFYGLCWWYALRPSRPSTYSVPHRLVPVAAPIAPISDAELMFAGPPAGRDVIAPMFNARNRSSTPTRSKPTVALALDGFLATHRAGALGQPRPGAAEFTRRLAAVARIVIHTTRANPHINPDLPEDPQLFAARCRITSWLDEHKFWYDDVWMGRGKPPASLYVDPKAVAVPLDPDPDDIVAVEATIKTQLALMELPSR